MGGTSESMTTIKESSSDTKKDDSSEGSHGDSSETDSKDSSGSGGSNGVKANAESPNSTEAALEDDYGDYDDLEDAPGSWQELFMDEIHSGDAVTAVVNVVMQLQGKASEFNVQALTKSIADYAGVPPAQVTLMHVWDGESNNSSFNYTAITTVSLALVVADPRTMIEHLYQLSDSGLQVLLSTNAGIKYLEQSMSAGIKYIALSLLEPQGQHAYPSK